MRLLNDRALAYGQPGVGPQQGGAEGQGRGTAVSPRLLAANGRSRPAAFR